MTFGLNKVRESTASINCLWPARFRFRREPPELDWLQWLQTRVDFRVSTRASTDTESDNLSAMNQFINSVAAYFGLVVHRAATQIRSVLYRPPRDSKKVAVICDSFIRYGTEQAIGLTASGLTVVLYYIDRLGEFGGDLGDRTIYLDQAAAAGVELVALPQRSLWKLCFHVVSLYRDIHARGITALIVHAHIDPRYTTLGFLFPVAMIIHDPQTHSGDTDSQYPLVVRGMARLAELSASCIFLHSERLVPQLHPILRCVPLGVVPHGATISPAPCPVTQPPMLLLVGRLMAYKGIDTALEALRIVREIRPDCTMVLAGRGHIEDDMDPTILEGVDVINRYISEYEISTLFRRARLVLLPYRDATQSGVGLQAISHGIPCIVSEAGALADLVPLGRDDRIVGVDDPDALARAILGNLDHGLDEREEVHSFGVSQFDWKAVGERLLFELDRLDLLSI